MPSDTMFKNDNGSKTNAFFALLHAEYVNGAIEFIKNNPVDFEKLVELLKITSRHLHRTPFCNFVDKALDQIEESTNAIGLFLTNEMKNNDRIDDDMIIKIIFSLIKCDHFNQVKALLPELLASCYRKMERHDQATLTKLLIDVDTIERMGSDLLIPIAIVQATENFDVVLLKNLLFYESEKGRAAQFHVMINALPEEKKNIIKNLFSLNEEQNKFVNSNMAQFSLGKFGKIYPRGGLLTCAQVASRKSYEFDPVLLNGMKEFKDYLATLKSYIPPHRERFILSGVHWISGDIQITKDGQVSILVIDSLGKAKFTLYDTENAVIEITRAFPEADIYFPDLQRQESLEGCSVFALDDVRHLYTVEDHLEPKFDSSGLHGYLADSAQKMAASRAKDSSERENKKEYTLIPCELPLPFVRPMQSERLYKSVIPKRSAEEKVVPVKKVKAGDDPVFLTESYAKNTFFKMNIEKNKLENVRLQDLLNKMAKFNFIFLVNYPNSKSLDEKMLPFTLAGFKKRLADKKLSKPVPLNRKI